MKQQSMDDGWGEWCIRQGGLALMLAMIGSAMWPAQQAQAHGAVAKPMARQYLCMRGGGYWNPPDGSAIPRPDCRAAFLAGAASNRVYPFQQWHELSANPANQGQDMADVRAAVPDGLLCAGGDPLKRGVDQVDIPWEASRVELDAQGRLEVVWNLTQEHTPSKLRVFLSRPSYDGKRPLQWADLEEIYNETAPAPVPVSGLPDIPEVRHTYTIKVPIPGGREGKAVLFNYWQRTDAGNEGFFNCSDIDIDRNGGVDPGFPWIDEKPYLPGFNPKAGDTVRFRVMGGDAGTRERSTGIERVDITWPITSANEGNHAWARELATKLNGEHSMFVQVGVLRETARGRGKSQKRTKEIVFDAVNLASNRIWLKEGYSSNFTLKPGEPGEPGDPLKWSAADVQTYQEGTEVIGLDGEKYRCAVGAWCSQAVPGNPEDWPYAAGSRQAHATGHLAWKPHEAATWSKGKRQGK